MPPAYGYEHTVYVTRRWKSASFCTGFLTPVMVELYEQGGLESVVGELIGALSGRLEVRRCSCAVLVLCSFLFIFFVKVSFTWHRK